MSDETLDSLGHLDTVTRSSVFGSDETFEPRVPGFTILAHPDPLRIGERSALVPLASGQTVDLSRLTPLFAQPGSSQRKPLADPHLSRRALRLEGQLDGGVALHNEAGIRVRVDGEVLGDRWIGGAEALDRGIVLLLAERIALLLHPMDVISGSGPTYGLVGESREVYALRQQISRVADLGVPVLLRGETGTGKEMVARALHQSSSRRSNAFVAVNMGAIPPTLAASELFGSVKGAFTGADRRRRGFFTQASGGTLFLDEIGETPGEVQAMLLRTLETGVVHAVGAETSQAVDVRVLAATDADLESEIEAGRFRAPLLHRLSGYAIRLPPLRERRDDIGRLLLFFLREELSTLGEAWRLDAGDRRHPWLPGALVARLASYSWPGNVRQLRNIARQLVIANRGARHLSLPPELESVFGESDDGSRESSEIQIEPSKSESTPSSVPSAGRAADADGRPVLRTLVAIRWRTDSDQRPDYRLRSRQDRVVRALLIDYDGHEVARREGFLLVFERPADAVGFSLEIQQSRDDAEWPVAASIGVFFGEVRVRHNADEAVARGAQPLEVEGAATRFAEALAELARDGQSLLDRGTHDLARQAIRPGHPLADEKIRWVEHGVYRSTDEELPVDVFEVGLDGEAPFEPPATMRHVASDSDKTARPAYRSPSEVDEADLLDALRRHAFRLQPTAKALGISRTSLYALIDRSNTIRKARDLTADEIEASRRRHDGDLDAMAAELEVSRKGLSRRMTELASREAET
ncbi:MAG: sigma 54-interacting transcriptional regulator [Acidobacteriota bacterium]